jgi:hypothetical protein
LVLSCDLVQPQKHCQVQSHELYEISEIYKKYYNNLGQRKQDYVRNVLDGHYCLLPEFILMLTRGDNNIDWRNQVVRIHVFLSL